jgi:hypothetical protein
MAAPASRASTAPISSRTSSVSLASAADASSALAVEGHAFTYGGGPQPLAAAWSSVVFPRDDEPNRLTPKPSCPVKCKSGPAKATDTAHTARE